MVFNFVVGILATVHAWQMKYSATVYRTGMHMHNAGARPRQGLKDLDPRSASAASVTAFQLNVP